MAPFQPGTVRKPRRAVGDAVLRLRTPSEPEVLVGPGRLELPTLRLSGVRSNHLSYGPMGSDSRVINTQARDRVTNFTTRMVEASMTKVERETETRVPPFNGASIDSLVRRRPGEASLERR